MQVLTAVTGLSWKGEVQNEEVCGIQHRKSSLSGKDKWDGLSTSCTHMQGSRLLK